MFERYEIKTNAKSALKHYYWRGLLACLIVGLLTGSMVTSNSNFKQVIHMSSNWGDRIHYSFPVGPFHFSFQNNYSGLFAFMALGFLCFVFVLSIVYAVFFANVLIVGQCVYFLSNREADTGFGELFANFRNGRYMYTVGTMFLKSLFIFLWSLLLVIPGIVKSYQYFFVEYFMAENPEMGYQEAFRLSKELTSGEKFNLFVFDLSFLGWRLLGSLFFGIGTIFVEPYYQASKAELFVCLKTRRLGAPSHNWQ